MMKKLKNKIKMIGTTATFCIGFLVFIFMASAGMQFVKAAYEEPTAEAPQGNIFVPLTASSDYQAKKGFLQLNPLYNPYGTLPDILYPLEVYGPNDVYINDLQVPAGGNFIVDTDTLYVDGLNSRVGVGTTTPATLLEIVGGGLTVGNATSPVSGAAISSTSDTFGVYGESTGVNSVSVLGQSTSASGIGVYGFGGTGIRAESTVSSAVTGSSSAQYDPAAAVKVAGIYGQARGLGAWAGYFVQRVFGSEQIVGRAFIPNRLQYSQVPYTSGWEVREISDSSGSAPTDIVFDGTYIWTANNEADTVSRFRSADGVKIADYSAGTQPQRIIFDGTAIWVSNGNGDLTEISAIDGSVVGTIVTGYAGSGADLLFDGQDLWLTFGVDGEIVKVDPSSGSVDSYAVGDDPTMMAFDGTNIWVINTTSNNISKIEIDTGTVTNDIYNFGALKPTTIIYDSTYLWVGVEQPTGGEDSIFKIDPSSATPILAGSYSITSNPVSVRSVIFDGINIWVSYEDNSLSYLTRIMSAAGEVQESVAYGGVSECSGASGIVFDGSYIWLSDEVCADTYSLHKFYSGSGLGITDLAGSVSLYGTMPSTAQAGSFATAGEANIGANLTVIGDLVVPNNIWEGTSDIVKSFGTSCDDGQFVKGINTGTDELNCRSL
ncbi:hypothetical protein IID19_03595 [Patescibacteria group bacterium]|nr:hypothetical protein [Patescibacteria group bacterium]